MVKTFVKFLGELLQKPFFQAFSKNTILSVGGHRGSGNTDRPGDIENQINSGQYKPAENTIPSLLKAFQDGASFVEIDVLFTKDRKIAVTHSDDLKNHVLYQFDGAHHVSERSLESLSTLKVGPLQNGRIPSLSGALRTIKNLEAYQTSDFCINIELKDVKDTNIKRPQDMGFFYEGIMKSIEDTNFDISKIVFSSFALCDLIEMRKISSHARLGMLFMPDYEPIEDIYPEQKISGARLMYFTPQNIREAWEKAQIEFAQPELLDRNEDSYALCAKLGLSLNFWMMRDALQGNNPEAIKDAAQTARKHGIRTAGFITDSVKETCAFIKGLP